MIKYIARRVLIALPLLALISVIAYALAFLLPGDVTTAILGPEAPKQLRDELRVQLGLDQPFVVQYVKWIGNFSRGEFGHSLIDGASIASIVKQRLPVTLELMALTMLTSILFGVTIGVISAMNRGSAADSAMSLVSLIGLSIPNFWLGMLLILLAMRLLPQLPISGFTPFSVDWRLNLMSLALPVITIAAREVGLLARFTRTSVLEVIGQDFVRTARAKGVNEMVIAVRHVVRNSLIPVITVAGLQIASLLSGLVIVETVFVLPGFGRLILEAILTRDTPVLLATIMIMAIAVIVVNLVVDLLYAVVDPRIKHGRASA